MTTLQQIYMNQLQKEITINENFQSTSIAAVFANRGNTGGLYYNYYGGKFKKQDGIVDFIDDGSILLTDNTTNYVYFDLVLGEVAVNTTGFPQEDFDIAKVITANGVITSIEDSRYIVLPPRGGIDVPHISRTSTTQTITSTTLASTELTGNVLANTLYHVEAHVIYTCSAQNNDINIGFQSPVDSVAMLTIDVDGVRKLFPYNSSIESGNLVGGGVQTANSIRTAKIKGLVQVGENAGTFDVLAAIGASGDTITIENGLLFLVRVG